MTERQPKSESIQESARNFIDREFLSKADTLQLKIRKSHVAENSLITPDFIRNTYTYYLRQSLDAYQDSGKSLERNATNLSVLKEMDEKLPEPLRQITLFHELSLFRNSLIAEIHSKIQNVEERTAAQGIFDDLDYVRNLLKEEVQTLNGLNLIETLLFGQ